MVIVEYNGMRLKTPTKVEEFREEFHDGFLYGEGLYVTSYIKHLFPEEYDHVCRETVDDGGGFFKEYIAAYNIFYKYSREAINGLKDKKINYNSNKEMDEIHYKTLNYIFKDVLKITDFKIYKLSSPEATEEELWQMKNIIY